MKKKKKKYWYRTDVYICPLCGREQSYKERIYNEKLKGTYIIEHWDYCGAF